MTVPQKNQEIPDIMEQVIIKGDLKKLTPDERVQYYNATCRSVGLNPLTRPFEYIELQGKLTLYARRDAADQLRKINGINIQIVSQDQHDGLLSVHVRATDKSGRADEDLGVVNFPEAMRGDVRANTIMKAVTKAKRRVTLSISGLGWMDETEVEDIPGAKKPPTPAPNVLLHDPKTGEITQSATNGNTDAVADAAPAVLGTPEEAGAVLSLEEMAYEAARRGREAIRVFYRNRTPLEQKKINKISEELNKIVDKTEQELQGEIDEKGDYR